MNNQCDRQNINPNNQNTTSVNHQQAQYNSDQSDKYLQDFVTKLIQQNLSYDDLNLQQNSHCISSLEIQAKNHQFKELSKVENLLIMSEYFCQDKIDFCSMLLNKNHYLLMFYLLQTLQNYDHKYFIAEGIIIQKRLSQNPYQQKKPYQSRTTNQNKNFNGNKQKFDKQRGNQQQKNYNNQANTNERNYNQHSNNNTYQTCNQQNIQRFQKLNQYNQTNQQYQNNFGQNQNNDYYYNNNNQSCQYRQQQSNYQQPTNQFNTSNTSQHQSNQKYFCNNVPQQVIDQQVEYIKPLYNNQQYQQISNQQCAYTNNCQNEQQQNQNNYYQFQSTQNQSVNQQVNRQQPLYNPNQQCINQDQINKQPTNINLQQIDYNNNQRSQIPYNTKQTPLKQQGMQIIKQFNVTQTENNLLQKQNLNINSLNISSSQNGEKTDLNISNSQSSTILNQNKNIPQNLKQFKMMLTLRQLSNSLLKHQSIYQQIQLVKNEITEQYKLIPDIDQLMSIIQLIQENADKQYVMNELAGNIELQMFFLKQKLQNFDLIYNDFVVSDVK